VIGITPKYFGLSRAAVTLFDGSSLNRVTLTTGKVSAQKVDGLKQMTFGQCKSRAVTLAANPRGRLSWRPHVLCNHRKRNRQFRFWLISEPSGRLKIAVAGFGRW